MTAWKWIFTLRLEYILLLLLHHRRCRHCRRHHHHHSLNLGQPSQFYAHSLQTAKKSTYPAHRTEPYEITVSLHIYNTISFYYSLVVCDVCVCILLLHTYCMYAVQYNSTRIEIIYESLLFTCVYWRIVRWPYSVFHFNRVVVLQ